MHVGSSLLLWLGCALAYLVSETFSLLGSVVGITEGLWLAARSLFFSVLQAFPPLRRDLEAVRVAPQSNSAPHSGSTLETGHLLPIQEANVLATLKLEGRVTVQLTQDPESGVQRLTARADRIAEWDISPQLAAAQAPLQEELNPAAPAAPVTPPQADTPEPPTGLPTSTRSLAQPAPRSETSPPTPTPAVSAAEEASGSQAAPETMSLLYHSNSELGRSALGAFKRAKGHATATAAELHTAAAAAAGDLHDSAAARVTAVQDAAATRAAGLRDAASRVVNASPLAVAADAVDAARKRAHGLATMASNAKRISDAYRAHGIFAALHVIALIVFNQFVEEAKKFISSIASAIKGVVHAYYNQGGALSALLASWVGSLQVAEQGFKSWLTLVLAPVKPLLVLPVLFMEQALALAKLPLQTFAVFVADPLHFFTPEPYLAAARVLFAYGLSWFLESVQQQGLVQTLANLFWRTLRAAEEEAFEVTVHAAHAVADAAYQHREELTQGVERVGAAAERVAHRLAPTLQHIAPHLAPHLENMRRSLLHAGVDVGRDVLYQAPRITWALILVWHNLVFIPLATAFRHRVIQRLERIPVLGPIVSILVHVFGFLSAILFSILAALGDILKHLATPEGVVTLFFVLVPITFAAVLLRTPFPSDELATAGIAPNATMPAAPGIAHRISFFG
ncbi:hypothetical protein WJX72_001583 [[Myrmecia] bisecta]|uniref:Uncharacterized protein n=1 Tax=[Myrmecia] bisecta TaxID=41462 RepID=A0AAW1Q3A4_9CHLO